MAEFADKYQFKNYIGKIVIGMNINKDMFDNLFANVFMEIFEKEKKSKCLEKLLGISTTEQIAKEVKKLSKEPKINFLLLFEDYQKMNNELTDLLIRIEKECPDDNDCIKSGKCIIDIAKYPYLCSRTERADLKIFKPEPITSKEFVTFIEENIGKHGLFFLYNLNKELIYIGKSTSIGGSVVDAIWDKNIDGYACVAYTKSKADIHLYHPYYTLKEKPLLPGDYHTNDALTLHLEELNKTELVKMYENT